MPLTETNLNPRSTYIEPQPEKKGFTLIELMVAITLLTIVVSVVYASFSSVTISMEQARKINAELQIRTFLTRNLRDNLAQAYDPWLPGAAYLAPSLPRQDPDELEEDARYWLVGEDIEGPDGPADKLTFASTAPLLGNTGMPGMLKQVSYYISEETEDEDGESVGLYRNSVLTTPSKLVFTEQAVEGWMPPPEGEGIGGDDRDSVSLDDAEPAWSAPIRSMNIRYFDGEEWLDEWSSLGEGRLPWSVEFRINFGKTDEEIEAERTQDYSLEDDPDLLLILSIPGGVGIRDLAPFYDE